MQHIRKLYQLANLYIPVVFAVHVLSLLFTNLGEDSLAFLASVWTADEPVLRASCPSADAGGAHDAEMADQLRIASLRHAAAFLEAHSQPQSPSQSVDFQTILPALLLAIQRPNIHIRQAAVDCIFALRASAQRTFSTVYALDWIYGKDTREWGMNLRRRGADAFRQRSSSFLTKTTSRNISRPLRRTQNILCTIADTWAHFIRPT